MKRHPFQMDERGFTLTEVIIASMVLLIALLVIASMFPMGHQQVVDAGRMTLAVTAGRQVLEDLGALPFDSVRNLNGFSTASAATLPAADPELAAARRWRYMIGGPGGGFYPPRTSAQETAPNGVGQARAEGAPSRLPRRSEGCLSGPERLVSPLSSGRPGRTPASSGSRAGRGRSTGGSA